MNDRERIISAVTTECEAFVDALEGHEGRDDRPLTAALVDLALVAVCPVCKRQDIMSGIIPGRKAGEPELRTERCSDALGYHAHLTIIREKGLSDAR